MPAALSWIFVAGLALHGIAHLVGTAGHMKLARFDDVPYTTTLLGGRWEVGTGGVFVVGLLYAVAAGGFVLSAAAWQQDWAHRQALLGGVTLFSLALTVLDWRVAIVGTAINVVILAVLIALRVGGLGW